MSAHTWRLKLIKLNTIKLGLAAQKELSMQKKRNPTPKHTHGHQNKL